MHRILSDLTPLIEGDRWRRIVLGGDFNVSTQCDGPQRRRDATVFARLEALGLVDLLALDKPRRAPLADCWCDDAGNCKQVHTHKHNRPDRPWHIDYLFASKDLAPRLVSCEPFEAPDVWSYSDHRPVVAVLDL
jgi:endonuclease/exonuclease/phosphatase family metal-dependent hydrolase